MDPASVISTIGAVSSLAINCTKSIRILHDLAEKYKSAEVLILNIIEECHAIEHAWSRIKIWAAGGLREYDDHERLCDRIQHTLYTGKLVMAKLQEDLVALQNTSQYSIFKRRTKIIWNENILQDHQDRIRGQVCALTLLLEVLQLPTASDRTALLSVQEPVFRYIDDTIQGIRPSTPSDCDSTNLSTAATHGSWYQPLTFESKLFTSYVYKRNFRVMRARKLRHNSDFEHYSRRDSVFPAGANDNGPEEGEQPIQAAKDCTSTASPAGLDASLEVQDHQPGGPINQSPATPSLPNVIQLRRQPLKGLSRITIKGSSYVTESEINLCPNEEATSMAFDLEATKPFDPLPIDACTIQPVVPQQDIYEHTSPPKDEVISVGKPIFHAGDGQIVLDYIRLLRDPSLFTSFSPDQRNFSVDYVALILRGGLKQNLQHLNTALQAVGFTHGSPIMKTIFEDLLALGDRPVHFEKLAPHNSTNTYPQNLAKELINDPDIEFAASCFDEATRSGLFYCTPTALQLACGTRSANVVEYLLSIGIPTEPSPFTPNPFILATRRRCLPILELFFKLANSFVTPSMKDLALMLVAIKNCDVSSRWMYKERNDNRRTTRDVEIVSLLLAKGANPNAKDHKGVSVLYMAISATCSMDMDIDGVEIVKLLLDAGARLEDLEIMPKGMGRWVLETIMERRTLSESSPSQDSPSWGRRTCSLLRGSEETVWPFG